MEISSGRDAATRPIPARDTTPAVRPALLPRDTLGVLQAEFPRYRIWREDICGRVRYIARSLEGGLRPHTIVTADLAEMRPALEPSQYALWTPFSTETEHQASAPSGSWHQSLPLPIRAENSHARAARSGHSDPAAVPRLDDLGQRHPQMVGIPQSRADRR